MTSGWFPNNTMLDVLENIDDMLGEPNPSDSLEREAAQLYGQFVKAKKNNPAYSKDNDPYVINLKEWKDKYASKDKALLKFGYKLYE